MAKLDGLQYQCKICINQYHAQYRQQNKEKISDQKKQWYQQNKEKRCERQKQYHQRVEKTDPYVYKVIHKDTGHFYYGRTTSIINRRLTKHKSSRETSLGKFINEHNLTREDLETEQYPCSSLEEATALERKLIAANIDNPLCLNKHMW